MKAYSGEVLRRKAGLSGADSAYPTGSIKNACSLLFPLIFYIFKTQKLTEIEVVEERSRAELCLARNWDSLSLVTLRAGKRVRFDLIPKTLSYSI